jgi:hypothetical protein
MELIETTPSRPYVGEIWDQPNPSPAEISALAFPHPSSTFKPYHGQALPVPSADRLVTPVFLPAAGGETRDCLWMCLTGLPAEVLGGAGAASVASGLIPKSWVGLPRVPGTSSFTTPLSIIAHKYPNTLGSWRVPRWISPRAPTGNPFVGFRMGRTVSLLRFVGRWIPGVGWALLASDLVVIDQCVANCTGKRSVLRAICEELTPFCAKPAY